MAFHLAQFNIAILKAPLDSPLLAGFVSALERINALAEQAPGFVWRLQDDAGDATALRPLGDHTLINMSVWQDLDALRHYVYETAHVAYLRQRREWFEQGGETKLVLWWLPAESIPSVAEGMARLDLIRTQGPTLQAFNFKSPFPAP